MGASSILLHCIWVAHGGQGHHAWQRQLGKGTYRLALAIPIIIQLPSLNLRHLIREDLVHLMWSWWGRVTSRAAMRRDSSTTRGHPVVSEGGGEEEDRFCLICLCLLPIQHMTYQSFCQNKRTMKIVGRNKQKMKRTTAHFNCLLFIPLQVQSGRKDSARSSVCECVSSDSPCV